MSTVEDLADVTEPYRTFLEKFMDVLPSLLVAIAVFGLIAYVGWKFSQWVTHGSQGDKFSVMRSFFQRIIFGFMLVLGLILVLPILGYTQIATFFLATGSVLAVIFGIAFREIGQNILAGFLLAINRPFDIGDLVAVGDFEGTVINLYLRSTHLRTYDGQDVFIPNTDFMQKPLVNYTRDGLRRFAFDVGIDYDNDADAADKAILEVLRELDEVLDDPSPRAGVNELGSSAVILRVYYWIDMFKLEPDLLQIRSMVINATKERLIEDGFDLPGDIVELQNAQDNVPLQLDVSPSHGTDVAGS